MRLKVDRTSGPDPVIILSNSLGTNLVMWERVALVLSQYFTVIRYDQRGHGASAPASEPYGIADLGADVISIMDAQQVEKAYFCGVSMGGQTGLWLAAHHPERLHGAIVSNTAPKIGTTESWNTRIQTVRTEGLDAIVDAVVGGWISTELRSRDPALFAWLREMLLTTDAESYALACAAVRDTDLTADLPGIQLPLLAIGGSFDQPTPAELTRRTIAEVVPRASFAEVPAGHVSPIEAPQQYAAAIISFAGRVR